MDKNRKFETQRLMLKPIDEQDSQLLLELYNTPKFLRYIGDRKINTLEDAKKYIRENMLPQFNRLAYGNFVVIRKSDNKKIGSCGLFDREGLAGVDIGFSFLPEYEKKGYAFESANKLKELALTQFGLKKIAAITTKENIESQKLIEKLGLQFVKIVNLPDDEEDLLLYELNIA